MFGKRLGDDQDASTRPKGDGRLRSAVGSGGKAAVELMQPRDCDYAVSLRDGIERTVKLHGRAKAWSHVAKLDDLAADGQGRQQSRALQRLRLGPQRRKPTPHPAT